MEGDIQKKFTNYYNDYFDKIYRFVFFRTGKNKDLTEDLVSEIFLKALEKFTSYDESISGSAWIFMIAKNHLANYWRDTKQTVSVEDKTEDESMEWLFFSQSLSLFKVEDSKREIYELLAKLSQKEQEIVTFHYLFGYSYLEIGEILQMSEGAAKLVAHRALKKLHELI